MLLILLSHQHGGTKTGSNCLQSVWFSLLSQALHHDRSLTGYWGPRDPAILLRPRAFVQICRLERLRCRFKSRAGRGGAAVHTAPQKTGGLEAPIRCARDT